MKGVEDMSGKRHLLIAVSDDTFFVSHRMALGVEALRRGWNVTVAGGENGAESEIRRAWIGYEPLPMVAAAGGIVKNLSIILRLAAIMRSQPGCIVHLVGTKMILLGNIAARLAGNVRGVVNAVSGLGMAFQNPESLKSRLIAMGLRIVKRRGGKVRTIVQNSSDCEILLRRGISVPEEMEYIKGSGVDLSKFRYRELPNPLPDRRLRVIFSGRLLKSKGILDFIRAAEILRPEWENRAEFLICGGIHHNPDSVTREDMERLCDGTYIRWAGHCRDMAEMLSSAILIAFPSYYREGIPLALLEASAVGLPIITCDSVGCRDTVDGNGFLVSPKNPRGLAEKIDYLLRNPEVCREMGKRSRMLAERDYDLSAVVERHIQIYEALI